MRLKSHDIMQLSKSNLCNEEYTVSEFQYHSVNYTVVAGIRKNFEQNSILNKASKACEWYFST